MSVFLKFFLSIFVFIFISNSLYSKNVKNSAVILMYHKFDNSKFPTTNVTLKQFESHIEEFSKPKYNVLPVKYILETILNDGELPENTIGITVDDADKSFINVAWPKFKDKGFPVTLFISTSYISPKNNKYLNWNEVRMLIDEGVDIGAHSHTHPHLPDLSLEEIKDEFEKSNKIFLKEIGFVPDIMAFPYGEASKEIFEIANKYNFKFAFGQRSGVINETSNFNYLPRFAINEKYGDIERVKFISKNKGLGVYDFVPVSPYIEDNPPYIGFSLLDLKLSNNINCFVFDSNGEVKSEMFKFNERIEIRLSRKLSKGRTRINCTVKDQKNNWRWFGHQLYL